MEAIEEEVLKKAKGLFPPWTTVLDDAFKTLEKKLTPQYVRNNFCAAVLEVETVAYEIFSAYEAKAFPDLVVMWMDAHTESIEKMYKEKVIRSLDGKGSLGDALKSVVRNVVDESFPLVRKFQISVGQMRKKRAGETFQEIILRLLTKAGVACEKAQGKVESQLGHTDIVIPDIETAQKTPDKSYFLACQRTLAERWWATTSISTGGRRAYVITIDKKLGASKADNLHNYHLVVFVRDDLKAKKELKSKAWVRSLSDLPSHLT